MVVRTVMTVIAVGEMDLRRRSRGGGGGAVIRYQSRSKARCGSGDQRRVVVNIDRRRGLRWWWCEMRRRLRGLNDGGCRERWLEREQQWLVGGGGR